MTNITVGPHIHARVHAATVGHPIVRSLEPGEDWRWAAYAAIGFGGQLIEVVPDRRLVAVFTADITGPDAPVDPYSYANILSLTVHQAESE